MTDPQYRNARKAFLSGDTSELRLGGYGGTITVRIVPGGVLIRTTKPRRRQRRLAPNSRSVRETAVRAAEAALERIRGVPSRRTVQVTRHEASPAGVITPREVWLSYFRLSLGAIPEDEVLGWGRKDVAAYMRRLSRGVREAAPSATYIYSMIQAARRLDRDGVVPLDGISRTSSLGIWTHG